METIFKEIKKFHEDCCGETPSRCYYQLNDGKQPINGPDRVSCKAVLRNLIYYASDLIVSEKNH